MFVARTGPDGRECAGVLHETVGEVPVLVQGTQRYVRLLEPTLGEARVR